MNVKAQLAELFANRNLPMDKYKNLTAFSLMEQESDLVAKLAEFRLPEITKLICGSDILSQMSWAASYRRIQPFYQKTVQGEVLKVIQSDISPDEFETEILCFADRKIWGSFKMYFEDLSNTLEVQRKEKSSLIKRIGDCQDQLKEIESILNEMEKEAEENVSDECAAIHKRQAKLSKQKSADEEKLLNLKNDMTKLDKFLVLKKDFIEKIYEYEEKVLEADSDENREKVYAFLTEHSMPSEEIFLNNFISVGIISDEHRARFRNESFVIRVLQYLKKDSYCDYALPILLKLYDEGVIDLIEGPANIFINENSKLLCDYLVQNTPQTAEDLQNPDLKLLIEKAIQKELEESDSKKSSVFSELWNTITDAQIWNWIVKKISKDFAVNNIDTAISCMMLNLHGKAAKSLVEALYGDTMSELKISVGEVISSLLKKTESSERDSVVEVFRLQEERNRKTQRRLNTCERQLRSHGQELFSSVYLPMEQLEELAINLKLTNGEIKASMVASHLIDIVISLREGLESLDLQPLADIDDWKNQNKLAFDTKMHRVITAEGKPLPKSIKLKSLGFRYQDDEGEWQQYHAQASTARRPADKNKTSKESPKSKKPDNKKESEPSAQSTDKKVDAQKKKTFDDKKKKQGAEP